MGLEFKPATIGIEVDGTTYQAVAGDFALAERAQRVVESATALKGDDFEAVRKLLEEIETCVSDSLGTEAAAAIFDGRKGNIVWHVRVLRYIVEQAYSPEANAAMMSSMEDLTATDDAD